MKRHFVKNKEVIRQFLLSVKGLRSVMNQIYITSREGSFYEELKKCRFTNTTITLIKDVILKFVSIMTSVENSKNTQDNVFRIAINSPYVVDFQAFLNNHITK